MSKARIYHGGAAVSGDRGFVKISQLWDNLNNLLVDCVGWLIHIVQTDVQADSDLNLEVVNDLNLTIGNNLGIDVTGNETQTVQGDMNNTVTGSINMTSSGADVSITGETDVNITASTGNLGLGGAGVFLTCKSGANQAAAGAIAGELWLDTTNSTYRCGT